MIFAKLKKFAFFIAENKTKTLLLAVFLFVLTGCESKNISDKIKELDKEIGVILDDLESDKGEKSTKSDEKQEQNKEKIDIESIKEADLGPEIKKKIDDWIEKNDLNRYGDAKDTFYAGGTPLFDESGGESIGRYEYILKNHPELIEELNN